MFGKLKPGCFSQYKIQVNSHLSQNDFPIPQYVKISFITSPLQIVNLSTESIDDQNICPLMPEIAACPGSIMSLRARPLFFVVYMCIEICLVIHIEGKLIRYSEQAHRYANGKIFQRLYTLAIALNCHTNIVHMYNR